MASFNKIVVVGATLVLIVPPEPVCIVIVFPAVPAADAVTPNVALAWLVTSTPILAASISATKLSRDVAASEPVEAKNMFADELSAGIAAGSAAINLNSVPPIVI